MPEIKHTPGPWKAYRTAGAHAGQGRDSQSEGAMMGRHTPGPWVVCDKAPAQRWADIASHDGYSVASCYTDNADANAHLVAAAPELLEALKLLMALQARDDVRDEWRGEFEIARAAIAKAEGGRS